MTVAHKIFIKKSHVIHSNVSAIKAEIELAIKENCIKHEVVDRENYIEYYIKGKFEAKLILLNAYNKLVLKHEKKGTAYYFPGTALYFKDVCATIVNLSL